MARDGGFHCVLMSKCTGTMGPQSSGLYLSRLKRNLSVFRVQWGVLALRICSMRSIVLLWVAGTKEEKSECACGRRCRFGRMSIFNLSSSQQTRPRLLAVRVGTAG